MKQSSFLWINSFLFLLFLTFSSCKKSENNDSKPVSNEKLFLKVRNIIKVNCTISCHAPDVGFNMGLPVILESDTDIVQHAQGIKAAVADPVTITNKRMPSGGMLSTTDIDVIVKWYAGGGTMDN